MCIFVHRSFGRLPRGHPSTELVPEQTRFRREIVAARRVAVLETRHLISTNSIWGSFDHLPFA